MEGRHSGPRRTRLAASFIFITLSSLSESFSSGRGILYKKHTLLQSKSTFLTLNSNKESETFACNPTPQYSNKKQELEKMKDYVED